MNTREYYLGTDALDLPPPEPPKIPGGTGAKIIPKYLGSTKGKVISNSASNTTNLSLASHVRSAGTMNEVIKNLVLTAFETVPPPARKDGDQKADLRSKKGGLIGHALRTTALSSC